jgi:hypothetical protein
MADPPGTQSDPPIDRISLLAMFRQVAEGLGSSYLAAQVMEPKVLSCAVPSRVRWHAGSPHARVVYGSPLGPLLAEEQATPELLKTLCEAAGMGFAGLLHDDGGIYANGKTAFVLVSRHDVAQFLPRPETPRSPEPPQPRQPPPEPLDPLDWIKLLIDYDAEQSAVIRDAAEHQRKPDEIPATFAERIAPVMDDAWRHNEVKRKWGAGYIQNQISELDLWPK